MSLQVDYLTVKQLIKWLKTQPKDAIICRYADGFHMIEPITTCEDAAYYHPDNVGTSKEDLEKTSQQYIKLD